MGKLDCVNANIFRHTQKKLEMIIGPELDRMNRPLVTLPRYTFFCEQPI